MHDAALIELREVTCTYERTVVFEHLSLTIPSGMFAGIVGPSGTGKTTFLKVLLGLVPVTTGSVTLMGQALSRQVLALIGYVPQLEHIDWNFPVTVEQVVSMGLSLVGNWAPWESREHMRLVHKTLESLGMSAYRRAQISELSGGQLQRVFLARALVRKPKLLLLDEPTNGIDIKTRHALLHLLADLHTQGITILVTTHDLNAVAAHLPWIICFHKGIVAQGPPQKVFTQRILSQTYDAPLTVIRHTGALGQLPFVAEGV